MSLQFGFGSGILYATRTDIAGGVPVRFGAFQDLQLDFSGDIKELYGQNQYALDVVRGKVKIEGKAKFAQISAALMNAVYFGGTIATGQTISQYGEAATVPGTTPYTVTVTHGTTFTNDLGVYDATTGSPYQRVTTSPSASGTYEVAAGGVYTLPRFSGTKWQVIRAGEGIIALKCLGDVEAPRWLDGRTATGTVGLAPSTRPPFSGTRWQIIRADDADEDIVGLKCLGTIPGPPMLDGRTQTASVGLAPSLNPPFTGARWEARFYPVRID